MDYTLRTARQQELPVLNALYTENMRPHVERLGVWDAAIFRNLFIPDQFQVIEIGEKIAGILKVVEDETSIYLAELQVSQSFQGQGIGSDLLRRIQDQSRKRGKHIWLKVLRRNPAIRLYERAGFRVFEETNFHFKMSWHAIPLGASPFPQAALLKQAASVVSD